MLKEIYIFLHFILYELCDEKYAERRGILKIKFSKFCGKVPYQFAVFIKKEGLFFSEVAIIHFFRENASKRAFSFTKSVALF